MPTNIYNIEQANITVTERNGTIELTTDSDSQIIRDFCAHVNKFKQNRGNKNKNTEAKPDVLTILLYINSAYISNITKLRYGCDDIAESYGQHVQKKISTIYPDANVRYVVIDGVDRNRLLTIDLNSQDVPTIIAVSNAVQDIEKTDGDAFWAVVEKVTHRRLKNNT